MPWNAPVHKIDKFERKRLPNRQNSYRRGYGGIKWNRTRERIFIRDNYTCRICGEHVIDNTNRNNKNIKASDDSRKWAHCDHITPKESGGSNDDNNLQTTCGRCHSQKTAEEGV